RGLLERYDVVDYYAVATSAMREAANRDVLLSRIRRETGVELTVIDRGEEARLVRQAVFAVAAGRFAPRVILDIGGGSLEISVLRGRRLSREMALPLGAVRLMEMFNLAETFTADGFAKLRRHVMSLLKSQGRKVVRGGHG